MRGLLAILVSLVVSGALGEAATAATPQDLTITDHRTSLAVPGHFVATGALDDSGSSSIDAFLWGAEPSPVVGTGHFVVTFHGTKGDLAVLLQTVLRPTDVPWIFREEGQWVVAGGTGAYAALHGDGTFTSTIDFLSGAHAVFTGQVQ